MSSNMDALAKDAKRESLALVLVFCVLAAGIVTAGCFYYRNYARHFREGVERQLSAIGVLKVDELVQYRNERLWDANTLFKNATFTGLVRRFFDHPEDADAQPQLQQWADKYLATRQYDHICLFDAQGVPRLSVPADRPPISSAVSSRVPEVLRSGQVTWQDFHRNEHDQQIYLTLLVPILEGPTNRSAGMLPALREQPAQAGNMPALRPSEYELSRLGVLALRINPHTFLYPFIKRLPVPTQTLETLLVRREGNEVVFLNELRFRTNTALNLRRPLEKINLLSVQAALGRKGFAEGIDYRDKPVIGDTRTVPNSPWFLVVRMDVAEAFAPLRERLWLIVLFMGALLLSAGAGVGAIWRHQRVLFYKERYQTAEALRESEVRYRRLFEAARDGILILDAGNGMVMDVNPFLIEILGYTRETFLGKKVWELGFLKDLFANQDNFTELQKKEYIRYEDLPLETSDGRRIEVEFVSNVYLVNHRKVIQCNIRDITARKQGEKWERLSHETLARLNRLESSKDAIGDTLAAFRQTLGFEAVAIRLREDDDFPYYVTTGFPGNFVAAERFLCARDQAGELVRDGKGNPALECMCGNILCGRANPALPFFTEGGSFWTNSTSRLLTTTTEADRQARTRNRCNSEGYESVALIPLRAGKDIIGLLQLNDHRPNQFTPETIRFLEGLGATIGLGLFRKQAEEAVRESEARYRQLFDLEADAIVLVDSETHRYVDVNQAAQRLYGYSREEFLQMTPEAVSAEPEKTQAHIDAGDGHVPVRWHRKKNGGRFAVEINANQIIHRGRRTALVALRDITARLQAEEALRKSEEKYRGLFESSRDAFMIVELPSGRFSAANMAGLKMFGMKDEAELISHVPWELSPERQPDGRASAEKAREVNGTALRNGSHFFEWRHRRLSGEEFSADVFLTRLEQGGKVILQATVRDITERKRIEEALRRSQEDFEDLFENAPVGYHEVDAGGRLVRINQTELKMLGYSAGELLGQFVWKISAQEETSRRAALAKLGGEPPPPSFGRVFRRKDGSTFPVLINDRILKNEAGAITGIRATIQDDTERKRAEEALRWSETHLRAILESTADGILAVDSNGKVINANQRFVEFGRIPQALLDRGDDRAMLNFVRQQMTDPDAFVKRVQSLYGTDEVAMDILVFKDGHIFERHGFPMLMDGAVIGRVWSFRDVTERRRQEEELKQKNAELERFTYTVSHDLKSPLVTVKTFLGYLEQDLLAPNPERVKQDVVYMQTATDKMGQLLDELLNLARVGRQVNPAVRVAFRELAQEAVRLVAGRISTSGVDVQVAGAAVLLEGDRPRLREIWQNLVENACKFMGNQAKPRIELGVERHGPETVFFVRDNGMGIEPRYQTKVFGLFEQLNPKGEGTGMGLALVKRIVELYGGRIWIESSGSGQGATILFTLPGAVVTE